MIMICILLIWLAIITLAGFLSTYIDKRRAKKHAWRIPEMHLILIAVLGGSIGVLLGMRLFHHKTRHAKFFIGIPLILFLQCLLAAGVFYRSSTYLKSPAGITAGQLSLIRDHRTGSTADTVFSSLTENIPAADSGTARKAGQAASLFYHSFNYKILSQQIDEQSGEASVSAVLTTVDTQALAKDLCLSLTRQRMNADTDDELTYEDVLTVLCDTLTENQYPQVQTEVIFFLMRSSNGWQLVQDDSYNDNLVAHLIQYISDPYLLDASEILQIYLDHYMSFSGGDWLALLGREDLFNTGDASLYEEIDLTYCEKLAQEFHVEIDVSKEPSERSDANVSISINVATPDMTSIMQLYQEKLLGYAKDVDSVTAGEEELNHKAASLLLESIHESEDITEKTLSIEMVHDSIGWYPLMSDEVVDAFTGGLASAADILQ